MVSRALFAAFSIMSVAFIFTACEKIKSYPNVPEITYKEYRYSDNTLVFNFVDGDGDFGLQQADITGPFAPDSAYYYNLFLDVYEKVDTTYVKMDFEIPTNYRVIDLPQPQGQNKTLRGTIELDLNGFGTFPDTFKLGFYVVDKSFHKSNFVLTPALAY